MALANSVDPDQAAPFKTAVWSGSALFARLPEDFNPDGKIYSF